MYRTAALTLCLVSSCQAFVIHRPIKSGFLKSNLGEQQEPGVLRKNVELNSLPEVWEAYNTALETDPLITKSITAGVILGAADCAGQLLENKIKSGDDGKEFDVARAIRFAIFGLVLQAPWNHFYYQFLDGVLPPTENPFTAVTFEKVLIDQFVQAPVFTGTYPPPYSFTAARV